MTISEDGIDSGDIDKRNQDIEKQKLRQSKRDARIQQLKNIDWTNPNLKDALIILKLLVNEILKDEE